MQEPKTRSAIPEPGGRAAFLGRLPLLLCLLVCLLVPGVGAVDRTQAQSASPANRGAEAVLTDARQAAPLGAELFASSCSVCHGESGLGLSEAKLAFPPDHRRCTHCHKRANPPTMSLQQIETRQHDLFDVGEPPPLRGEGAMAANSSSEALQAYIAATMPRYRPGALAAEEYAALTDFLMALNGR